MGLGTEKHFQFFYQVLNRLVRSSRETSRLLLGMWMASFAGATYPVVNLQLPFCSFVTIGYQNKTIRSRDQGFAIARRLCKCGLPTSLPILASG